MAIKDFIGNKSAVESLKKRAAGTGGHAYLLTGPTGIGKRTLAEDFAAALLCEKADGPCGTCSSCQLREAGNHPDLHILPDEGNLPIAMVRDLSRALGFSPHSGRNKVGIIPDAERLAVPAQNALLKLLEEPPARSVLILTAPSPASLLPTTVSRAQRVQLGPVPIPEIAKRLRDRGADKPDESAELSEERPGRAIRLNEDPEEEAARGNDEKDLLDALGRPVTEQLALAKRLSDQPEDVPELLDTWISVYRRSLRNEEGESSKSAIRLAEILPLAKRIDGLIRLFAARRQLRYNPNTQLLLERLLINLAN